MRYQVQLASKFIITALILTSTGYYIYETVPKMKAIDTYVPSIVNPTPEECKTSISYFDNTSTYFAMVNLSSKQKDNFIYLRENCRLWKFKNQTKIDYCDYIKIYNQTAEMDLYKKMNDMIKITEFTKVACGFQSFGICLTILNLIFDLMFCVSVDKCCPIKKNLGPFLFLVMFIVDCTIAPFTITMGGNSSSDCVLPEFTVFSIGPQAGLTIGVIQYVYFAFLCCCRNIPLYWFFGAGWVILDIIIMIVMTLSQPLWLIIVTGIKLLLQFVIIIAEYRCRDRSQDHQIDNTGVSNEVNQVSLDNIKIASNPKIK